MVYKLIIILKVVKKLSKFEFNNKQHASPALRSSGGTVAQDPKLKKSKILFFKILKGLKKLTFKYQRNFFSNF